MKMEPPLNKKLYIGQDKPITQDTQLGVIIGVSKIQYIYDVYSFLIKRSTDNQLFNCTTITWKPYFVCCATDHF